MASARTRSLMSSLSSASLTSVFRSVIPEPEHRIPLSWGIAPHVLAHYLPFVLLAYIARRPNTYFLRLLLLPIVLYTILSAAFGYQWTIPSLNVYNWGQCLLAEVLIAKTLQFTLSVNGVLKIGETSPGVTKGKEVANGHASHFPERGFFSGLLDAIELIHTMRGLRFKFGLGTHIPPEARDTTNRVAFLRATAFSFLTNLLLLDFIETIIKLFPGVGTVQGGSIFYPSLPVIQRYFVSTIIHLMTGCALLAGFNFVYNLITLVAVGICGNSPNSWPPAMDNPWIADSMHSVWAKRWHQFLRHTFLILGGYPGKWLAGDLGLILGTFIASGLFHELASYSMGRGFDHTVTFFFALQGPILICERLWRRLTGRRVGGIPGRLWVYFVMFVAAQPMTDSWHKRGLGGAMIIPPFVSPAKLIIPIMVQALRF